MFGSAILEVAIGLIFVYVLLSLIASAFNEVLARWGKVRSKNLQQGLVRLLPDDGLLECFCEHPLINSLREESWFGKQEEPLAIPPRTFALVIFDILSTAKPFGDLEGMRRSVEALEDYPRLGAALLALVNRPGQTFETVEQSVEEWFDLSMASVSSSYKRKMQSLIVLPAILVTVLFNADTFEIASALSGLGPAQRQEVVTRAEQFVNASGDEKTWAVEELRSELDTLDLPLGWSEDMWPVGCCGWFRRVLGWSATAALVSLGAPFWFNMLSKLSRLRSPRSAPAQPEDTGEKVN